MSEVFQVPSTLYKVTSMSHWWRLIFDTQENVTPQTMSTVLGWMNQLGHLTFAIRQIEAQDLLDLPEIKTDDRKPPSQRMRAVLYRSWEKDNRGHKEFTVYYEVRMEQIINKLKEQLE